MLERIEPFKKSYKVSEGDIMMTHYWGKPHRG